MAAARQHHNHQETHGSGQPLSSHARTAHDYIDHAGEQLVPSAAEALRRINVFWEYDNETHFFVQYDAQGNPHSSWVLQGFDYFQHFGGGPPLLRLTPASAAHAHLPSEADHELEHLKGRVKHVR